jgi:osmotically-inducible protein OsmY
MSPFRFHDDDSSTGTAIASVLIGAVAGFAVGMYVAQRVGGFSGLTAKFRRQTKEDVASRPYELSTDEFENDAVHAAATDEVDELDEAEVDDPDALVASADAELDEDFNGMDAVADDGVPLLEERVLEAFNNDPILAERAIDIGTMGAGIIELAGWVDSDDEAEHAMTIARGVPGVETVVNRLLVDDEEHQLGENIRRFQEGDPALNQTHWEGQQVGTGKRRQGTSDETDRHADPKPPLGDRWLSEREAVKNAAEDIGEISAERRKKGSKAARAAKADEAEPPQEA